jgi:hypothetical protein
MLTNVRRLINKTNVSRHMYYGLGVIRSPLSPTDNAFQYENKLTGVLGIFNPDMTFTIEGIKGKKCNGSFTFKYSREGYEQPSVKSVVTKTANIAEDCIDKLWTRKKTLDNELKGLIDMVNACVLPSNMTVESVSININNDGDCLKYEYEA